MRSPEVGEVADQQPDGQQGEVIVVQLVHAEAGSRVVLVQAKRGERLLDAALGEAATAELAEDRARQRLQSRRTPPVETRVADSTPTGAREPVARPKAAGPIPPPSPSQPTPPPLQAPEQPQVDPEDWSSELAQLDLQLQRLGWDRDQEATYLERVFGHPNRNRLTNYADIQAYLEALKGCSTGTPASSAPAPLRRRDLLSQCDQLLELLQWDPGQGRALLEQHFSLSSRQQLSDAQLLQFNMLLEDLSNTCAPTGPPG